MRQHSVRMRIAGELARLAFPGLCCLLLLLASGRAAADNSEADIKAAFIYNFAKFVEWPEGYLPTDNGVLRLCVLGETPLGLKLRQLEGREAQGRRIDVRMLTRSDDWPGCHMMFVASPGDALRLPDNGNGNGSVLTISESPRFLHQGGIISLFVDGNRVQFSVNLPAAQQAGLKLSARLLQLARTVNRGD